MNLSSHYSRGRFRKAVPEVCAAARALAKRWRRDRIRFTSQQLGIAILTAFTQWLGQWLPGTVWTAYLLDMLVSFLVITFLFALIFKLLPDVTVSWKDVWIGAVFTAVLFMVGKFLIGMYIGSASIGSVYGAAGSLVVVLVWTYYSSQILFFGAELIRAYAKYFDTQPIVPTELAVPMTEFELVKQGMPSPGGPETAALPQQSNKPGLRSNER